MKKTATMYEYKVGINAIIVNFMCMWTSRLLIPGVNATDIHQLSFFRI